METSKSNGSKPLRVELEPRSGLYRVELKKAQVRVEVLQGDIVLICRFPTQKVAYVLSMDGADFKERFLHKTGAIYSRSTAVKWDDLHVALSIRAEAKEEPGDMQIHCRGDKAHSIAAKFMERFPEHPNPMAEGSFKRGRVVRMNVGGLVIDESGSSVEPENSPALKQPYEKYSPSHRDHDRGVEYLHLG